MSDLQVRRWTRGEYERMVDAGILGPGDRVELIEGEVVRMTPQNEPHAAAVSLAEEALREAFGEGFLVRPGLPLALSSDSEPEPDVAVVPGTARNYVNVHPSTALLILEIANSSLAYDRGRKARLYARAGLADYWIVNLVDRVVEVSHDPSPDGYGARLVLRAGESMAPLARPKHPIAVSDLLP